MCTCNNKEWSTCGECSEDMCSSNESYDTTWVDCTTNNENCCENASCNGLIMIPETFVLNAGVNSSLDLMLNNREVNSQATWRSSDYSVVSVDEEGNIETLDDGTAIISATYNGMTASCKVIVDSRPAVRVISRNDGSFGVDFVNQKADEAYRWKSVGCDLNLPENRSGYDIWLDDEENLNYAERNRKYNSEYKYTSEQLSLLYRLDPFGVVDYVGDRIYKERMTITQELFYKDEVYKAIFVVENDKFYFRPNDYGTPVFGSYAGWERKDVYSLAELVFGKHSIVEFDSLEFGLNVLKAILGLCDALEAIFSTIELCQVLFFNSAIQHSVSSEISSYLSHELEVTEDDEFFYPEQRIEKKEAAFKKFKATSLLLDIINAGLNAIKVLPSDIVDVCRSIKKHVPYRVIFQGTKTTLELESIIAICDN